MTTLVDIEALFTHVEQGALRARSKYGIEYELFNPQAATADTGGDLGRSEAELFKRLYEHLKMKLEHYPAQTKLVWRTRPDITYDGSGTRIKMWARYHLIDPRLRARRNVSSH